MKRFTETTKWANEWFQELEPKFKCLWLFICDNADAAGVWEPNFKLASFQIGQKVIEQDLARFGDRVKRLRSGKILIRSFIGFQYGKLSETCKAHIPVFRTIAKHSLSIAYPKAIGDSLQEMETETEEVTETEEGMKGEVPPTPQAPPPEPPQVPPLGYTVPECLSLLPGFQSEWAAFEEHRKKIKKPLTDRARTLVLNRLAERPEQALAALQKCIERGWQSFEWDWIGRTGAAVIDKGTYALTAEETTGSTWNPLTDD